MQVKGIEDGDETDMAAKLLRFIEGYRDGRVIQKRIANPSLMSLIDPKVATIVVLLLICVVLALVLIISMVKDEPPSVGSSENIPDGKSSAVHEEPGELLGPLKED